MNRPYVTGIILALAICTNASATALKITDDDAAADRAETLTREYKLSGNPIECLDFETTDQGKQYLVQVRENHTPECGGDPDVAPTVFFLKIRKSDGHALIQNYLTGQFVPLRKPKHKQPPHHTNTDQH
jgi:hypothetical protein